MIQYCGEPPLTRGKVLGLRTTGLEFRSLCLEGSVISFISLCAQRWPKTPFISFNIEHVVIIPSIPTDYNKKHKIN